MQIDTSSEFGQRVARRLQEERIIWLTTVDANQVPQPRPVWFWWDGESFLIYSRPGVYKLRHIERNPQVSLHFDSDGMGSDIVVFTGDARVDTDTPPADQVSAYAEKYQAGFARIGQSAQEFARSFSVALRVVPTDLRGH